MIKKCRVCGNKNLEFVYSLGPIALSDFTDTPLEGHKIPLALVFCTECELLQLDRDMPRDLLYGNYWYESHISPVIVEDLKQIGNLCWGIHIDIGANDGTLLKHSNADSIFGVDPSNVSAEDIPWYYEYWENVNTGFEADAITAIACIYDLPNPNAFIKNVKRHLAPEGIFISQLMTLQPMLDNFDLGNICHEHLEYYSYKSLVTLFEQNGLEIYKVEKNSINGGSYRLFAKHYTQPSVKVDEPTYTLETFKRFFRQIEKNKDDMMRFLEDLKKSGIKIGAYGASTKGNVILQYYEVDSTLLSAIYEKNPDKVGKFTINTNIPIKDDTEEKPHFLWVLPYAFLDNFIKREKRWYDAGGNFIISTPEFKVC